MSSHIDQAQRYARGFKFEGGADEIGGPWNDSDGTRFVVPFVFSSNGRPYLKQIETESGIWFRDVRKPTNHRRALVDWPTPDGLKGTWLTTFSPLRRDSQKLYRIKSVYPSAQLDLRFYVAEIKVSCNGPSWTALKSAVQTGEFIVHREPELGIIRPANNDPGPVQQNGLSPAFEALFCTMPCRPRRVSIRLP